MTEERWWLLGVTILVVGFLGLVACVLGAADAIIRQNTQAYWGWLIMLFIVSRGSLALVRHIRHKHLEHDDA